MQALFTTNLPALGNQPTNGRRYAGQMPKSGKKKGGDEEREEREPTAVAAILARSVVALLAHAEKQDELRDRSNGPGLERYMRERRQQDRAAWGDDIVTKSTIDRIIKARTGASIDTVAMIANSFPEIPLEPWQLLHPGFDPANPPYIMTSEREEAMYAGFRESMKRLQGRRITTDEEDHAGSARRDRHTKGEEASEGDVNGHDKASRGRGKGKRGSSARAKAKS